MIGDLRGLRARGRFGRSIDAHEVLGSTNDEARRAASAGAPDGHVVIADRQTAGRGTRGRTWESPGGTDLYFSIVARTGLSAQRLAPLTLAAGLGVARALEALASLGGRVSVKWPNDARIDDRKCAGILVETTSAGAFVDAAIVGIGLNVNRESFDGELEGRAISLREATSREWDRAAVLAELLAQVEQAIDLFVANGSGPIALALEPLLAWRGERVRCEGVRGVLLGVAESGALRIRTADGERELVHGTLELDR